ncbi:transglutaminase-like domain-containing protein [Microbulbifer agarilyticus]|uniref:transglutaminase-like domain-containing protein n=1 Tax=Microbulbifer agarilyticus TaxID=260552 RepID=UPI001C988557|nr:transglutaminase-like domain-containing protein [Microbulbifer agarilyticus]MBY6189646.1 transglutaminase-like domain-containing protein [Microbulbifer agarilyticus]
MRGNRICQAFLAFVLLVCVGLWLNFGTFGVAPRYDLSKTVRYGFLVENNTSSNIEGASFRVFAPVKKNSYQENTELTANYPFKIELDELGNQVLVFDVGDIAPLSRKVINITATLKLAGYAQVFKESDNDKYLISERNIQVDSPVIRMISREINPKSGEEARIANWISENITDVGYVAEDRGAHYALVNRKGDCTEFSSAFVALARASDIPSRMIGGFVIDRSGRLQANNYHNWSEFMRDNAWHIADPQNNIFDSGYGSYIAFYNFNERSRMNNSHRFLTYDSRLSVQML